MRDIFKLTETIEIAEHYEIKASEIAQLLQLAEEGKQGTYDAILTAFKLGYEMGIRSQIEKHMQK